MKLNNRKAADLVYQSSFPAFVCQAYNALNPGQALIQNWHIDAVCIHLQNMESGDSNPHFVLNQPPRSLKSFIVSVCFAAWVLGRNPTRAIIVACYNDELSRKFSRDCRALMETAFYRRVFPGTRLNPKKSSETEFETTKRGGRYTTSVGGTLTGRGADILIVDDPIKVQDGQSELARKHVLEWFKGTAYTRRNDPGKSLVIVMMQRVHEDDLSGVLIEQGWPKLALSALAEEAAAYDTGGDETYERPVGELLQPRRDSVQALEETRRQLGSYVFAAQFQQNPTPADGNLIKKEWLKRYDQALRLPKFQNVILACDPAGKPGQHNDYTAIVVAGITTNDVIVLHVARGHWTQMQMGLRIEELKNQHVVDLALIEDTATGVGLIQDLRRRSNISVLGVTPKADKESRLYAQLGQFEAGQVLLPMEAPWLADFERELLSFPATRNDDQVDALILILERFRNRPPPIPMTGPIFFTIPRTTMRDWR